VHYSIKDLPTIFPEYKLTFKTIMKLFHFVKATALTVFTYVSFLSFAQTPVTVTGSGTTNNIPRFSGASTVINSQITDNGTTVSLGTASVAVGASNVVSGDYVSIIKNQIYKTKFAVRNTNNGINAGVESSVISPSSSLSMNAFTAITPTSGIFESSTAVLNATGAGGINIGTQSNAQLSLWTNNTKRMTIDATGNVGIGSVNPSCMLEVGGNAKVIGFESSVNQGYDYGFNQILNVTRNVTKAVAVFNTADPINTEKLIIWGSGRVDVKASTKTDKYFVVNDVSVPNSPVEAFSVQGNGYTQYNVSNPTAMPNVIDVFDNSVSTNAKYLFRVTSAGHVFAREVEIRNTTLGFPDYVFAKEYKLMPLSEVEQYIDSNKHLPGFEKGEAYDQNGIKTSELIYKQQEKIEELTLYIIDLEKRMKAIEESVKH
jgi:hypothetical protein